MAGPSSKHWVGNIVISGAGPAGAQQWAQEIGITGIHVAVAIHVYPPASAVIFRVFRAKFSLHACGPNPWLQLLKIISPVERQVAQQDRVVIHVLGSDINYRSGCASAFGAFLGKYAGGHQGHGASQGDGRDYFGCPHNSAFLIGSYSVVVVAG